MQRISLQRSSSLAYKQLQRQQADENGTKEEEPQPVANAGEDALQLCMAISAIRERQEAGVLQPAGGGTGTAGQAGGSLR